MKTEDLIIQLASGAGTVRPLHSPAIRFLRWAAVCIPLTVLIVVLIGPRENLETAINSAAFLISTSLMLATSLVAAACALATGVPGRERTWSGNVPLALAAIWIGILLASLVSSATPTTPRSALESLHALCIVEIAGVGLLSAFGLFEMLRRAAPLRPGWSAVLAALAGLSLGTAATEILCPISAAVHLVFSHAAPATALTMVAALMGRSRLDWLR